MDTDTHLVPLFVASAHGGQSREAVALRRAAGRSSLVRVHRGVYVDAGSWRGFDARERHVVTVRAVMTGLADTCVVSHGSAAAMLGLPSVDRGVDLVNVIDPRRTTVKTTPYVRHRPGSLPTSDLTTLNGLPLTSPWRTALDIARTAPFADAVLCLDAVLRRVVLGDRHRSGPDVDVRLAAAKQDLVSAVGPPRSKGSRAALRAVDFASPWAENGGESLARVVMHELGAPAPRLQVEFTDARGLAGRCDFWFEEIGGAFELDGAQKYEKPTMLDGRSALEVVREQNRRQSRLLEVPGVRRVDRFDYLDLVRPRRLADKLQAAGMRLDPGCVAHAIAMSVLRFGHEHDLRTRR